jgi:hypothetical protein
MALEESRKRSNAILLQALRPDAAAWAGANAIRERLASAGRSFSDSAELLREDRER